jgi:alcohol dehydrogenase class IV
MGLKAGADMGDAITELNLSLGIPRCLADIGVSAADGPGIVDYALADLAHAGNARPFERRDYEILFEQALN